MGTPVTLPKAMADTLLTTIYRRLRVLKGTPNQSTLQSLASPHARCLKAYAHRLNFHLRHTSIRWWLTTQMESCLKQLIDSAAKVVCADYQWDRQSDSLKVLDNIVLVELGRYTLTSKRAREEDLPSESAFSSPPRSVENKGETLAKFFARDQYGNRYKMIPTDEPGQLSDVMVNIPPLASSFSGEHEDLLLEGKPKADTSVDEERDDPMMSPLDKQDQQP